MQDAGFRVALLPEQTITNSLGMKLQWIPAGKFTMGSPPGEPGRHTDEKQHDVSITRPFYLGVYKVTVGQFKAFAADKNYQTEPEKTGQGATWRNPGFEQTDGDPVVYVNWDDAVAFCAWLSKKGGQTLRPTHGGSVGVRLPRRLTDEVLLRGRRRQNGAVRLVPRQRREEDAPCGPEDAQRLGPFRYARRHLGLDRRLVRQGLLQQQPHGRPTGSPSRRDAHARGGAWNLAPRFCRSAHRNQLYGPTHRENNIGFRVVLLP